MAGKIRGEGYGFFQCLFSASCVTFDNRYLVGYAADIRGNVKYFYDSLAGARGQASMLGTGWEVIGGYADGNVYHLFASAAHPLMINNIVRSSIDSAQFVIMHEIGHGRGGPGGIGCSGGAIGEACADAFAFGQVFGRGP